MNIKKCLFSFLIIFLLSGCSVTYDLEISPDGISENIFIDSVSVDGNYFVTAYYDSIPDELLDVDVNQKVSGVEYYETIKGDNNIKFSYKFPMKEFQNSNVINAFYSSFTHNKYDYDMDGEEDYYMLVAAGDFSAFNLYNQLTDITIRIKNNYEVISSNAEQIDGNVYIWNFTPGDNYEINMIYNPDKVIDNRNFFVKLFDKFSIVFIGIFLLGVGYIIYYLFKKYSDKKNEV